MKESNHLITKMIIGPYAQDPKRWTERIIFIHSRLVESMGAIPYAVISNHCNRMAGCYSSTKNPSQHERALRSQLALIGRLAMEPENELYILTDEDGRFCDQLLAEFRVWMQVREDLGWKPNIYKQNWSGWLRTLG